MMEPSAKGARLQALILEGTWWRQPDGSHVRRYHGYQTDMATPVRAHCPHCGHSFTSYNLIQVVEGAHVTLSNVGTNCPRCGSIANIEDGTYGAIGRIVEVARASAGGLEDLIAFHSVAKAVQNGTISRVDAAKRVRKIGNAWLTVWNWLNANGTALSVVISILGLCIAYYAIIESDAGSNQAHSDALAHIRATETQTQVERSELRVERNELQAQQNLQQAQEKIYELLAQQQQGEQPQAQPTQPKLEKPKATQLQMPSMEKAMLNRHDRRKAAKLARSHRRPP